MALSITKVGKPFTIGDRWTVINTLQGDSSYPAGGYSCPPSSLGFGKAANSDPEFIVELDSAGGWGAVYNYSTQKVQLFSSTATTQAEVTAGTNVSTPTFRAVATSKYIG